jgi:hypothetical protein
MGRTPRDESLPSLALLDPSIRRPAFLRVVLMALMLVDDARKAMGERRYGQGHERI